MDILFNETYNRLFQALCQIINEIHDGKRYEYSAVLQRIQEITGFQYANADTDREKEIIHKLFIIDEHDRHAPLQLFIDAALPVQPSALELRWLKTMLLDEAFQWLLPDTLRKKMLSRLQNICTLVPPDSWTRLHTSKGQAQNKEIQQKLRIIQEAFQRRCQLHYVNQAENGHRYEGTVSPCRLEYDLSQDHYALIIWQDSEERAIKINLANLLELSLSKEHIPKDLEKRLTAFFTQHRRLLILQLKQERNAVERCFSLFSSYDKTAFCEENLQHYELEIQYYDFEETDILRKILSLGAAAIVIKPAKLRDDTIRCLKDAYEHYCN